MVRPAPPVAPPSAATFALLPLCVLANGALFWPAACLVAIAAAVAQRPGAMLVWYGLAVGFDANALVLAPFVVALCVRLRAPWPTLPLAPACALAMLLARSQGVPLAIVLPQDVALTRGAPTLWAIAQALPGIGALPLAGLAMASALGAAMAYTAWATGLSLRRADLLDAALLGAMLPVLLPAIGPQALLLADALALIVAVLDPRAGRWRVAGLVVGGTTMAWLGRADATALAAVAMLAATLLHARMVLKPAANDNPRIVPLQRAKPLPSWPETC
ncbi:hypothetical protein [Sphingomonas sp. PAMC 26605]|uniref:hypothetical protein n=1 Tax=Sphingomonas sp. PAMC 26605 TaxID=1112214 RepID=UPI0002E164E7|nr:hypothetical protein [Sphingomonas sp. PAMC 26605]